MPTIQENLSQWNNNYDWSQQGEEWSVWWGGSDMQWYGAILPRLHRFVPTETILEIAPGFGRWTQFLKDLCRNLILVDLSEKCIQACKNRFSPSSHITYYLNDGKSLEMISNNSIDCIFSFDSLVHADAEAIKTYLNQMSKKLKKNGIGFLHHSNIGAYSRYLRLVNKLPRGKSLLQRLKLLDTDAMGRDYSMTAYKFERYAYEAGLQCISQELINWGCNRILTDCISIFTRKDSDWARPNKIVRNKNFMKEVKTISKLSKLYGATSFKNVTQA